MDLRTQLSNIEAAAYLGVKPKTLERWRRIGHGPLHFKVGSLVKYDREALDDFLNACRTASAAPKARR